MVVGKVEKKTLVEETEIKWKILDFPPFSEGRVLRSPDFCFGSVSWYLEIYKKGGKDKEFMSLYLNNVGVREYSVEYNFGLEKRDGSVEQLMKGILNGGQKHNPTSEANFINELEIYQRKSELLPSGIFTIRGRLKFETISSIQPSSLLDKPKLENLITKSSKVTDPCYLTFDAKELEIESPSVPLINRWSLCTPEPFGPNLHTIQKAYELDTLSENFKDLMTNKESCDTTLHVQNKEYKAHRTVLIARSSVFAAMFLHETSEKQTGIVTIPDCDPESFEEFLKFLYYGKLEKPSPSCALHLVETSDKYNVQELKKFCVEYLMENLTAKNLCDAVILAEKYDEANLMSAAQDFFNRNFSGILQTSEWDCLVKNNYRLSKKLLTGLSSKIKIVD